MNALAAVMLDDPNFPHGTPDGNALGCKSARSCPEIFSCKEAGAAARHDYKVARLFKEGATSAQVAAYLSDGIEPVLTPAPESAPTPTTPDAREHAVPTTDDTSKPTPRPKASKPKPVLEVGTPAAIRAWARTEGYEVAAKGRIAPIIAQKYNEAHGLTPLPEAIEGDDAERTHPGHGVELVDVTGEPEPAAGGIVTVATIQGESEPGNVVPWSEVVDIARRSDMLDETRERIDEPVDDDTAFRQDAADAATRPEWADVAAAAEIAAATRRAEQAEQIAARALAAVDLVLQKWENATARAQAATERAEAAELDTRRAKYETTIVEEYLRRASDTIAELDTQLASARRPLIRFGGAR